MRDIKLIHENPEAVRKNLEKRGDSEKLEMLGELIRLDKEWRQFLTRVDACCLAIWVMS